MDVLPLHFGVFQHCGFWYEFDKELKFLKRIYKYILVSSILILTIGQIIEIIMVLMDGDLGDLTESLFLSLTFVTFSSKTINFLYRRRSMEDMINKFRREVCQSRNPEERNMVIASQKRGSTITILVLSIALITDVAFIGVPFLNFITKGARDLPIRMYHPYSLDDVRIYFVTYLFQSITLTYSAILNISLDLLPSALMLYTYGQFEMCCYRFSQSKRQDVTEATKTCIQHQVLLRRIVENIQLFFMDIVLLLFLVQMMVLCTSIFKLSQTNIDSLESFKIIMYLMSMLNQIFFYCWAGNELTLKSTSIVDTMCEYDWTELVPSERKNLLLIMILGQREMQISYHGLCVLSLQTFVWIIKTSFAAFNLLQSITEE